MGMVGFSPFGVRAVEVKFICNNCGTEVVSEEIGVPEPDYSAENHSDSTQDNDGYAVCENCDKQYDITVYAGIGGGYVDIEDIEDDAIIEVVEYDDEPEDYEASNGIVIESLYIEDFKNIKKQTFDFTNHNGLTILIGNNGSGKSNVIEAISSIFYDIYNKEKISPIRDARMKISYGNSVETIIFNNGKMNVEPTNGANLFFDAGQPSIIPQKVVAIYSGEEERLKKNYFDDFLKEYITSKSIELPKMVLLNRIHWDIALLCLLYSDIKQGTNFCTELLPNIEIVKIRFDFNLLPEGHPNAVVSFIKELQSKPYGPLFPVTEFMKSIDIDVITLFQYLYFAKSQQKPLIDAIRFIFKNDAKFTGVRKAREQTINNYGLESLSEGQKKQLLFVASLEFAGQQNTLFLFDEPDVHVHIGNKKRILDKIKEYTHNRHIFISTHSPTLCKYAPKESILLMEKGVVKPIKDELEAGKYLADDNDVFKLLFSIKHIVITEGKTDCQYIKKAIELYKIEYPELQDFEFVSIGGTDGVVVKDFLTKLREIEGRKIIVLVDRDGSGLDCAKKVLQNDNLKKKDIDFKTIPNATCKFLLMLPNSISTQSDFVIEDCFDNSKIKELTKNYIDANFDTSKNFNDFPKVKDDLKKSLLPDFCKIATKEDMKGFLPLLDKLKTIINADYGTVELSQKDQSKPRLQPQKTLTITNTFYQE